MIFSWLGNRQWTYRHQHREKLTQELALFTFVNVVGVVITAGTVYVSRHTGGLDPVLSDNVARIFGWGVATLFRFFAYRCYVCIAS
ncbi:hypothetical protein GCM10012280_64930 [Wenjunlia tyrosinilytica]|uniref:GtrA/DPMS transmembrane domain-containing protein n=2 Tax=Wenjunlia tyrosinilytica TaxID=1544741 RepID=A0A917ZXL7_9ACTN|nr:hypothetical protein GCM10012280_64930 [Wenjunlia tyrosinilytica]